MTTNTRNKTQTTHKLGHNVKFARLDFGFPALQFSFSLRILYLLCGLVFGEGLLGSIEMKIVLQLSDTQRIVFSS